MSFYYVLNKSLQTLVAISSSGYILISHAIHTSVRVLTPSLSLTIACIPLSPTSALQHITFLSFVPL
jgi:hypothetical protein